MVCVAYGGIVEDTNACQVWLDDRKIFDIRAILDCTMLSIVAGLENFALGF